MDYRTFEAEILKDHDRDAAGLMSYGGIRIYFETIKGARLTESDMPLVKDAFWSAYDIGFQYGLRKAEQINARARAGFEQ